QLFAELGVPLTVVRSLPGGAAGGNARHRHCLRQVALSIFSWAGQAYQLPGDRARLGVPRVSMVLQDGRKLVWPLTVGERRLPIAIELVGGIELERAAARPRSMTHRRVSQSRSGEYFDQLGDRQITVDLIAGACDHQIPIRIVKHYPSPKALVPDESDTVTLTRVKQVMTQVSRLRGRRFIRQLRRRQCGLQRLRALEEASLHHITDECGQISRGRNLSTARVRVQGGVVTMLIEIADIVVRQRRPDGWFTRFKIGVM